tara:strand:- start:441 stop:665 length:225 start_codon:yes stop_codon:yes gene_type:complete
MMLPPEPSFELLRQLRDTQKIELVQLNKRNHQIGLPIADDGQIFSKIPGAMNSIVMRFDPARATAHPYQAAVVP